MVRIVKNLPNDAKKLYLTTGQKIACQSEKYELVDKLYLHIILDLMIRQDLLTFHQLGANSVFPNYVPPILRQLNEVIYLVLAIIFDIG